MADFGLSGSWQAEADNCLSAFMAWHCAGGVIAAGRPSTKIAPSQLTNGSIEADAMDRFVVISGCSGGGKSTLLAELERRGYTVFEEPGRRIIAEERKGSGRALPWVNLSAFAKRAIEMSLQDRERAKSMPGIVFFDRGLIDAAAALEYVAGKPILESYSAERYNPLVFVTPPWPEIYVGDEDRQHDLQEAVNEYERLLVAFSSLGYDIQVLPKVGVGCRADLVIQRLGLL